MLRNLGIGKILLNVRQIIAGSKTLKPNLDKLKIRINSENERRVNESLSFFAGLKNKFQGKRGFVIGNGPSLRLEDLELLKNEVTLAANKVYLAFDKVSWRPTYLTIVDPLVWQKVQDDIWKHHNHVLIPSYLPELKGNTGKAKTFLYLGNASDLWRENGGIHFSDDFSVGAYGGYTVTYENLQFAVYLGLNPIYIIGCDHFYKGETKAVPNTPIKTIDASNHFLPGYRAPGVIVNP